MQGTPRAITKTAFSEPQLLALLQELAPGNARMALDVGRGDDVRVHVARMASFEVEVTARAEGLRAVVRAQSAAATGGDGASAAPPRCGAASAHRR